MVGNWTRMVGNWTRPGAARAAGPRKRCNMSELQRTPHTILHFSRDHNILIVRGWFLNIAGYRVLNSSIAPEAIELSKGVDAAVLDMDHNRNEVTVIAQEIKRRRPELPTIVLTEGQVAMDWQLADALVPKESGPETLVKSLEKLLAADRGESAVQVSASL
jgi:DNA-binding NtrC family response regulator